MKQWFRAALKVALVLALLFLVGSGALYWWLSQALPQIEGDIRVAGLKAPVRVLRDEHAIPRIEAESIEDALFAQGFVHAQDRLWQMEFQRRIGAGRLAEIVGKQALPIDRFMRTLGLYRLAKTSLQHLSPETKTWLEAYASGVNAFLDQRSGPLPPEFLLLRHSTITPWQPADSLVWIKMMALDLSLNWRRELLRARLSTKLDRQQLDDLWPDYPSDGPITLTGLASGLNLDGLATILPPAPQPGIGSNGWVVAGELSKTGKPLLANDPHLGLQAPGVWYLLRLNAPQLVLTGASLPGVPGVVLGHNGQIAWGMTNTGPDTQDLFIERFDPNNRDHYQTPAGSVPFTLRNEKIHIKGGDVETWEIRSTRHGPLISDLMSTASDVNGSEEVLALAWAALVEDDTSIETLFGISKSRHLDDVLEAAKAHVSPQQNVFYADRDGHIGLVAPGVVPVRRGGDGQQPVPGWRGDYDWIGTIPFEDLPKSMDPPSHMIVNANNRIVAEDYPYLLTATWEPPYRARRIESLLRQKRLHDLESFAAIQSDEFSSLADEILPLMLQDAPFNDRTRPIAARLSMWNRKMAKERSEPLIFAAWYREFTRLAYADELGPLFLDYWNIRPQFVNRILRNRTIWCDRVGTATKETCPTLAARALDLALDELESRYGENQDDWHWGVAHRAKMSHPIFDDVPFLGSLFNIVQPMGGDSVTINVGHYVLSDEMDPFSMVQGASYRGLYDLDDLDRSTFIAATGQSGHPLSPHYRDLTALWAEGQGVTITDRTDWLGELTLSPSDRD